MIVEKVYLFPPAVVDYLTFVAESLFLGISTLHGAMPPDVLLQAQQNDALDTRCAVLAL